MQKHDRSKQNVYSSKVRYETAYNALKKISRKDTVRYSQEILSGKYGFIMGFIFFVLYNALLGYTGFIKGICYTLISSS